VNADELRRLARLRDANYGVHGGPARDLENNLRRIHFRDFRDTDEKPKPFPPPIEPARKTAERCLLLIGVLAVSVALWAGIVLAIYYLIF